MKEVVIRFYDVLGKWGIAYAKSYQPTFRSTVNAFDTREDAVAFIDAYNARKDRDFTLILVYHEHDQLRERIDA